MSDDPQTIIAQAVQQAFWEMSGGDKGPLDDDPDSGDQQVAWSILAARYPAACPICLGKGEVIGPLIPPGPGHWTAECLVCPTIGKLLEVGAAVMTWTSEAFYPSIWGLQDAYIEGGNAVIDHLRRVEP